MTTEKRSILDRFLRWWRSLWPRTEPPPQQTSQHQGPQSTSADQKRYEVQDGQDETVAESGTFSEAHQKWQQLTDQHGRIIDRATGKDVTPPPDDNGRFVVLDKDDRQLGSFDDYAKAEEVWRDRTNETGRIVDVKKKLDVTPQSESHLTKEQLGQLHGWLAGKGPPGYHSLEIDESRVRNMINQITRLDVPVFDVTNTVGQGQPMPTKTVPINRRKVEIVKVKKKVWEELPGPPQPSGRVIVPYPTDDTELAPMRSVSDIRRVPRGMLAMPREILRQRIARRQLLMRDFHEELPGKPTVRKRQVYREFEEPKVHEWTEEVEVSEEPRAQLLEIVTDVSGSMAGDGINLAVALASVVVGAHLDDGSRYFYRPFASIVGKATKAATPAEKRDLLVQLMQEEYDLGGGTRILEAIQEAAEDVRSNARGDDRPEILLITDGKDSLGAFDVYEAIGSDVTLHTVVVNAPTNNSLKERSSTYYELVLDLGQVKGSREGGLYRFNLDVDDTYW